MWHFMLCIFLFITEEIWIMIAGLLVRRKVISLASTTKPSQSNNGELRHLQL